MRWEFAGRARVVTEALEHLEAGQSLVITGDAGVGKSRLARELTDRLDVPSHAVVGFGAAPALAGVPLGALARYANDGEDDVDDARGRFERTVDDGDADAVDAGRLRAVYRGLLEAVADEPVPLAPAGRRIVLLVDDVQWLDPLSATAAAQLVVSGDAVMVATRRTTDPAPEAIRRLRSDGTAEALVLPPLSLNEVADLLAANYGPVERQTVEELHTTTGGNVRLLEDLVRAAQASGTFAPSGTSWMWDGTVPADAELNDLMHDHISRLTPEQIDALSVVAAGEPVPLPVARAALASDVLAALERDGVVLVDRRDHEVRFAHSLYGKIVRSRMGELERSESHARLVKAAGQVDPAPDAARVAVWALEAGEDVDPADLVVASERAIAAGDNELARRLAERALEAGDRPDAVIAVGRSMALSASPERARAVLSPLIDRPNLRDADRVAAGLWLLTAHQQAILLGVDDPSRPGAWSAEQLAAIERSVQTVLDHLVDPSEGDLLRAEWAFILLSAHRWREALPMAEKLAASERDDVAMRAMQPFVVSLATSGRSTTAADIAIGALPRALAAIDAVPEAIRWVFGCSITTGLIDGRLAEVQGLLDLAGGAGAPAGAEGYFSMIRGKLALLQGRPRSARTELEAATRRLPRAEASEWGGWTQALLVEAIAIGEPGSPPPELTLEPVQATLDAVRAVAWGALGRGDRREALAQLAAAADQAADEGNVPFETFALHDALRLGARPSDRLEDVVGRLESRWSAPVLAHGRGCRDGDLDQLDQAALGFEEIGAMLLAAECWATEARLAAERGLGPRARRASARSALVADLCEGATTPALDLPSPAPRLTARERIVAEEAAAGRRSRDIAEGLRISVRTVDNLLGRVYTKLGVRGRDELAELMRRPPRD